jgi:hypothetical protein
VHTFCTACFLTATTGNDRFPRLSSRSKSHRVSLLSHHRKLDDADDDETVSRGRFQVPRGGYGSVVQQYLFPRSIHLGTHSPAHGCHHHNNHTVSSPVGVSPQMIDLGKEVKQMVALHNIHVI